MSGDKLTKEETLKGTWNNPKLKDLVESMDDNLEYIGDVLNDIKDILKQMAQQMMKR